MPDLKIFIAQDIEFYHSHPFWYLDVSYGTKNCQLRLLGDLQNAATKVTQSHCNYANSLTY